MVTSFLFFSIPIFQELTPELLARTKPDVRDVLIAIAGGLTLIVALSRYKEMTNTILCYVPSLYLFVLGLYGALWCIILEVHSIPGFIEEYADDMTLPRLQVSTLDCFTARVPSERVFK